MRALLSRRGAVGAVVGSVAVALTAVAPAGPVVAEQEVGRSDVAVSAPTSQTQITLQRMGTGNLGDIARASARRAAGTTRAPASADPTYEIPKPKRPNAAPDNRVTPANVPTPDVRRVTGRFPDTLPFQSLTAVDSRYANNGNQFTNEPPDQALCVGNGFTMASVNTAIAVYDRTGAQLAPTAAINEFFGLAPQINRETARPTFGPFAFDPVCYFDPDVKRWFYVVTELDQDVFSGNFTGVTNLYLAVSMTADPLGDYAFFGINTTNGDSTDRGCPCFDDFPHVGADSNGFYITANRFSLFEPFFNGAQVHAISKRGLARAADGSGSAPTLVSINAGSIDGDPSFTVQPATTPAGGTYAPDREYFLSTTDFDTAKESKIGVWALSNTDSLDSAEPAVRLSRRTIPSLTYALEPKVEQKPGRSPLGDLIGEPLNVLDSGSDMSEVKYVQGRLFGAIGTAVGRDGRKRDGVLWVQVQPTFADGRVDGRVVRQGYVAVGNRNSVMYPAIGVNADGQGAMVMSLAGPNAFPSPSYVKMNLNGVRGPVRVPEFGQRPDDGFTCYAAFVGSRDRGCRWGDYSSAVADGRGRIWMATEFIPDDARLPFANWATIVMRHTP
ncbi:MAG: hypothetical protein M3467_06475 [Actinomycetota bacterium]|jgi:hypothetical protein|nr:hypothetical protein [Acidothermales bacterium]MDQ3431852.1 hypothetical protein [Actinomycetota bacterium]